MSSSSFLFYDAECLLVNRSTNRGNFLELLQWSAGSDPTVQALLDEASGNASYMSPEVQNELIQIMANQVRHRMAGKVWFSLNTIEYNYGICLSE